MFREASRLINWKCGQTERTGSLSAHRLISVLNDRNETRVSWKTKKRERGRKVTRSTPRLLCWPGLTSDEACQRGPMVLLRAKYSAGPAPGCATETGETIDRETRMKKDRWSRHAPRLVAEEKLCALAESWLKPSVVCNLYFRPLEPCRGPGSDSMFKRESAL